MAHDSTRVVERGQGDVLVEARVTSVRKRREQASSGSPVILPRRGEMGLSRHAGPSNLPPPEARLTLGEDVVSKEPHNPMYINVSEAKRPRGNRRRSRPKPKGDGDGPDDAEAIDDGTEQQDPAFQEEATSAEMAALEAEASNDNLSYYN